MIVEILMSNTFYKMRTSKKFRAAWVQIKVIDRKIAEYI